MSKPQIDSINKYDRVVVLIDMDCFYCQVEEQLDPTLKGKPIAVVQYNAWRGGGIIAVNYPARDKGVTRHMRGDEAKAHCPDIELVRVPNIREKADLSKYRNAGKQVAAVLQTYTPLLSRASVDEAYLDITEQVQNRLADMNLGKFSLQPSSLKNTFAVGYENIGEYVQVISQRISKGSAAAEQLLADIPDEDRKSYRKSDIKLLIAASIVTEMRNAVKEKTGYECSAGIAHNRILAKLVCGMNKPNKQTILPLRHIQEMYKTLPLTKVQGLGGKFGEKVCEDLSIKFMSELVRFTREELQQRYDTRAGHWLYNIARGIDLEAIVPRLVSKSIGCCKKFPGRNAITAISTLNHWLNELAQEIGERLEQDEEENNRRPKQMVVSFIQEINKADVSSSRTVNLTVIDQEKIAADALDVLKRNTEKFFKTPDNQCLLNNPIKFLGLNVGKFEDIDTKRTNTIQNMFQRSVDNRKAEILASTSETGESRKIEDGETGAAEENITTTSTTTEMKKEEKQKSFFEQYRLDKLEKQRAAEEAARLAAEKEAEEEDSAASGDEDRSADKFDDDMLQAELDSTQADVEQPPQDTTLPAESTISESAAKQDYTMTYAEFYCPPIPNLPKVKCEQCGKMVPEHEVQVHQDSHFAHQLAQEQRVEFQNQLKRTLPPTTPTAPKRSKAVSAKVQTPGKTASIQQFLRKTDASEPVASTSRSDDCGAVRCDECAKMVRPAELMEHMDFHAAKKLHDEMMRADMTNRLNNNASTSVTKTTKTKKKAPASSGSGSGSGGGSKKNIASFFQTAKDEA